MSSGFDHKAYGEAFTAVLREPGRMPLDSGAVNDAALPLLKGLTVESAFAGREIVDLGSAESCLAAAWLLHGFLDEAHRLCQDVPSASGSYWHGVVHRREGDYGNAAYWFRRAGEHPAGSAIASAVAEQAETALDGRWDPHRFNEQVQLAVQQGGPLADACVAVQLAEWRTLFDFCWRRAVGD